MADQLMNAPKLYGTFLLWLLSELFEQLPVVSPWFLNGENAAERQPTRSTRS